MFFNHKDTKATKTETALAIMLLLAGCAKKEPLPVYAQVPPFQLTSQDGKEFRSQEQLDGRVWVADFIYTNCQGPCPRMSALMRRIQQSTKDMPQVRLVSFTVDPARDTPEVMAAYAQHYDATPGRWFFLTGTRDKLQQIYRYGFLLGDVDGSMIHSTRFVLVDARGRMRGLYDTADMADVTRLAADVRRAIEEK